MHFNNFISLTSIHTQTHAHTSFLSSFFVNPFLSLSQWPHEEEGIFLPVGCLQPQDGAVGVGAGFLLL